jgi:2-C-methyl-D-erythritol 4-phosphate cytidylyltransferase/2-C-methyl-D-erythritol 2,4-cyclodiphosphate synthase
MGGVDKLATPIGGRPLLARTLDALAAADGVERIVVVAHESRVDAVRRSGWLAPTVVSVVAGGDRRQESVAAGLAELERLDLERGRVEGIDRVVLVHDGARPLVSRALIDRVARAADAHGAAIPVLPIAETVKRVEGDLVTATVDRSTLATAQTPQGFRRSLVRRAYEAFAPDGPHEWTDEAGLLEACAIPVHSVAGDPRNLKVTVAADLAAAEAILDPGAARRRVGLGRDSHPFGPGEPLALGGVAIPGAPRLHGHSDGDVALHALADALLGAAALGDLGRIFPPGPETPSGISSLELVRGVVARLVEAGWRPVSADVTIVGARPRLGPHLDAMQSAMAEAIGVDRASVGVKASTGNLSGDEGAGRILTAHAVAVIEPA